MQTEDLQPGQAWTGPVHHEDGAVFEFSKDGPELRLFFAGVPPDAVREVQTADCHLGLLRAGDVAVVPWKIGEHMAGDAHFHVFLYPPESRPTDPLLNGDARLPLRIVLVDRDNRKLLAVRRVLLSQWLSQELAEAVAYQLGNHIGREGYDAQVAIYQNQYPDVQDAIKAAPIFERVEG
ncbi:MAG TPA: hypothetical protein VIM12_21200 [Noviherbaspirillum sp.]|jgi:hypothetical protein|uniref:hypothetical protein n=1 Tax=Noviherbaspirillum sp. TaxID=1926288 RepID=UPI002F95ED84